jgi:hypothetical protein
MKTICFFSNGHNGDIVHSKSFVEHISQQLDVKCLYHHKKNFKITQDLSTITTQICPSSYYEKFVDTKNIFFVNTWLYPYLFDNSFETYGVNIKTNYKIYNHICETINSVFDTSIKLNSIDSYLPFIDFNFIDTSFADDYVLSDKNVKVLFCNGPCLSGQSPYNGNMSDIIEKLASSYKDITFIATDKFNTTSSNIKFTSDILKVNGCDLNEIGYLSTHCNLIIGRNSGPFCFCTIDKNFQDPNKIFYAFGHNKTDCFYLGTDIKSKFTFDYSDTEEDIYISINQIIIDNLI